MRLPAIEEDQAHAFPRRVTPQAAELADRLSSASIVKGIARQEIARVFGHRLRLRRPPESWHLQIFFEHGTAWFVVCPVSTDTWVVDIARIPQTIHAVAFTPRAAAFVRQLGWKVSDVEAAARAALAPDRCADFRIPLEEVRFEAVLEGGIASVDLDDMQLAV